MTDLLSNAAAWLESQRLEHLSRTALYIRGSEELMVHVTIGKSEHEVQDEYGIRNKLTSVDFILAGDELLFDDERDYPVPGDTIRLAHQDKIITYEVMNIAGQGCWRFSDSNQQVLRVHTQWMKSETL